MSNKNILILYAGVGSGHRIAAEALSDYLRGHLAFDVMIMDIFDFSKIKSLKSTTNKINTRSFVFGSFYNYLWNFESSSDITQKMIKPIMDNFSSLKATISEKKPDIVICTHSFAALLVSEYKKKQFNQLQHFAVTTDLRANKLWPTKHVDYYFVSTLPAKVDLVLGGVPSDKITISGIPLRKEFYDLGKTIVNNINKVESILVLAGSLEADPYKSLSLNMNNILAQMTTYKIYVTVVCGKNRKLVSNLNHNFSKNKKVKVLGYISNMAPIIKMCDVVATKPGGLITSEAIYFHKPMILLGNSYGQERANANFLVSHGVAIEAKTPTQLVNSFRFVRKTDNYVQMVSNISNLLPSNSTENIANQILKFAQKRT